MKSKKVYQDYHWARDESILDSVLEVNIYRDVLKHFPVIHKRCKGIALKPGATELLEYLKNFGTRNIIVLNG